MKKHIIMIAAALMLGTVSFAQGAGPKGGAPGAQRQGQNGQRGPGGMGRGMDMQKSIYAKLGLSAAQMSALEKLNKAQMDKFKAMRDKAQSGGQKPPSEADRAQFKKMRDAHTAEVKKILTPAQFKKMEELMAAERAKFMKMRGAGPGGKPGKGG